jgi:hypothetical protein
MMLFSHPSSPMNLNITTRIFGDVVNISYYVNPGNQKFVKGSIKVSKEDVEDSQKLWATFEMKSQPQTTSLVCHKDSNISVLSPLFSMFYLYLNKDW